MTELLDSLESCVVDGGQKGLLSALIWAASPAIYPVPEPDRISPLEVALARPKSLPPKS